MSFKIEKNVDVPPHPTKTFYPWSEMVVGDSFLVRCESDDRKRALNAIRSAGHGFCTRNRPDCTIAARQQSDGVRVWLVQKQA